MSWYAIEDAPKDGSAILTLELKYLDRPELAYTVYFWRDGWTDGEYGGDPDYWMPLPGPPK